MDIVLPTRFNNPNLPQRPGFIDTFERPAADSLGTTDDGRPWTVIPSPGAISTWGTTGNGTGGMLSASYATHFALVDSEASDGVLTAHIADLDMELSGNRFGLAFRMAGLDNYFVLQTFFTGQAGWRLTKVANGVASTAADSPSTPVRAGDTISIALAGESIAVYRNGGAVLNVSDPDLTRNTSHGLFAFATSDVEWSEISFTP